MAAKRRTTRAKKSRNSRAPRVNIEPPADVHTAAFAFITRLRATLPALTEAEQLAYRSRFDDAACDKLGGSTKSANVVSLLVRWAAIIADTLGVRPKSIAGYGPHRFAYLLEQGAELVRAIEAERAANKVRSTASRTAKDARAAAKATHKAIRLKLSSVAGSHPEDLAALEIATNTDERNRDGVLATSLQGLGELARRWLASEAHAPLVRDVSLSAGDVQLATEAASALVLSAAAESAAGRRTARDTPLINRAEGRVLAELRVAFQVFRQAHRSDRQVPQLPVHRGTERVFVGHHGARVGEKTK